MGCVTLLCCVFASIGCCLAARPPTKIFNDDRFLLPTKMTSRTMAQKSDNHTDRILAMITPPEPILLREKSLTLNFQSAVPTFGPDASYIALLHKYDEHLWDALKDTPLFCSGPERSHRAPMRVLGGETSVWYKTTLVLQCDWPREEEHAACYEVFLEEANGTSIGHLRTCYNPNLLKEYITAACVTSVWDDHRTSANPIALLPQWIEYNLMHGVEHLLVYTMTGTDPRLMTVFEPYIEQGLATRVHLDIPDRLSKEYQPTGYSTQAWFANDCMYRMKYHAKWLFPTIDGDEYLRVAHRETDAHEFSLDNVEAAWASQENLQQAGGLPIDHPHAHPVVHSISFGRYTFRRPEDASTELQLASPWREEHLAHLCPKFVVKPALVNALFIHWPTSWVAGAVGLGLPEHVAVANHYRTDSTQSTSLRDSTLVAQCQSLSSAIQARFQSTWQDLSAELSSAPSSSLAEDGGSDGDENSEHRYAETVRSWISDFNTIKQIQLVAPPAVTGRSP
mmetsp:Transcript_28543/g.62292  ORF Transcript_28543/g.62292 Transcript_28543/m.62292 type:complete len:508 (+) Transcript_28543:56-1579(+)